MCKGIAPVIQVNDLGLKIVCLKAPVTIRLYSSASGCNSVLVVAVGEGACRARNDPVSSDGAVIQGKDLLLLLLPVAGVAA